MSPDRSLHRIPERTMKRVLAQPNPGAGQRAMNLDTMNRLLLLAKVLAK